VWVPLVGRFRILLTIGSMVTHVVEDWNDAMRCGIRIFSQCTVNQKLGIRTDGHVAYAADVVGRLARGDRCVAMMRDSASTANQPWLRLFV